MATPRIDTTQTSFKFQPRQKGQPARQNTVTDNRFLTSNGRYGNPDRQTFRPESAYGLNQHGQRTKRLSSTQDPLAQTAQLAATQKIPGYLQPTKASIAHTRQAIRKEQPARKKTDTGNRFLTSNGRYGNPDRQTFRPESAYGLNQHGQRTKRLSSTQDPLAQTAQLAATQKIPSSARTRPVASPVANSDSQRSFRSLERGVAEMERYAAKKRAAALETGNATQRDTSRRPVTRKEHPSSSVSSSARESSSTSTPGYTGGLRHTANFVPSLGGGSVALMADTNRGNDTKRRDPHNARSIMLSSANGVRSEHEIRGGRRGFSHIPAHAKAREGGTGPEFVQGGHWQNPNLSKTGGFMNWQPS